MTVAGTFVATLGALLTLLAAIGILRLPDLFARLHAATKASSLGIACLMAGTALLLPAVDVALKVLVAAIFQFLTAPVAAHVIGRAAYRVGVPRHTVTDELAASDVDRGSSSSR